MQVTVLLHAIVLQCDTVCVGCCRVWQGVAGCCIVLTPATLCNTLQQRDLLVDSSSMVKIWMSVRNMSHSYVRHDSFICETWLIPIRNMTHSYVTHDSFSCETWLIHVRNMTNSYVRHDSFTRETWLSHACLQCPTTGDYGALHHTPHCNTLQQIVIHCTLQNIATHCNTLQHTTTHCNILDTATHCSTLQHTATHCCTLQHTRLRHLRGKPLEN